MVILDIGHGYDTPGKRSRKNTAGMYMNEWQINVGFAMAAWRRLTEAGIKTVFSSTTIEDMPLKKRVDFINSHSATDTIVLSFHANAADSANANGFELLHYPSEKSGEKAESLLKWIEPWLRKWEINNRGLKRREDLYLLNYTKPVCLLIEVGFMTNSFDFEIINNPYYQDAIGRAVAAFVSEK